MSGGTSRRGALKLFAAGAGTLVAGCQSPAEEIVPYRDMPEGMVPGQPMYFATSLPLAGAGRGVIVESHQGRPTKVHGNPAHPASLGATDAFAEAEVLALFDPNRSRAVLRDGRPESWDSLQTALVEALGDGDGVALVTGPIGSPTLARQVRQVREALPALDWYAYRSVAPALELASDGGARQVWPDFERIDTVVSLGADPLGPGPAQIAFARRWSDAKRRDRARFRSFAFEPRPTLTGAQADRREAVASADLDRVLAALERGEGEGAAGAAAASLSCSEGRAIVLGGSDLSPALQSRIVALNERIGAPVAYLRPFWQWEGLEARPIDALSRAVADGSIRRLIFLGCNPVYDLGPAFADVVAQVPDRLHFGSRLDETARLCRWHGPLHHPLEDWSDLRAVDGTVGLVQPLIAPLHDTRSSHEILSMMTGVTPEPAHDLVRSTWRAVWGEAAFEQRWRQALHDGVIAETGAERLSPPGFPSPTEVLPADGMELILAPSPSVLDGSFADNAWLQECPEPFTKQVWGNAVWLSLGDALRLGVADGDAVRLSSAGGDVVGPAIAMPGQADGVVTVHSGYGRTEAGPIGSWIGFSVASLGSRVRVEKVAGSLRIVRTQTEFAQHGRDVLKTVPTPDTEVHPEEPLASFFDDWSYPEAAWGMVIDTDACIGCNACMIACQSENNVPVVGPEEVARGRYMHWLRIDAYDMEGGVRGFQPVPCMHCEKAPCEPVCPTAASVHDSEGLNVQVYNRCIGTRFCQANCPYKVRRFNFFDYADGQAYENLGADLLQARANPDVSVRTRGVMEKCTYCVQRISAARRQAEIEDRPLAEADVTTACQAACPTEAIVFGNLNDPGAEVRRAKEEPRHYALLHELGTRPRTTYLARVVPDDDTS